MINEIYIMIGAATLGYEIVYSDLAHGIKKLLFLDKEYPIVNLLTKFGTYSILGRCKWLLLPVILLTVLMANIHRYFYRLLECPYCTSFQLALWTSLYFFSLWQSIQIASCTLFVAGLYNLIRIKSIG